MDFIRKDGRIDIDTENENLANKNQSLEVFSFENCNKLKKELLNLGLNLDTIEKVIVKSPVILLYSNQLDSVYYLFKNKNIVVIQFLMMTNMLHTFWMKI